MVSWNQFVIPLTFTSSQALWTFPVGLYEFISRRGVVNWPLLGRAGWHDHHTRVSAVCPAPDAPAWLVFYDGSGTDDYGSTWNLRTGVAVAHVLRRPVDTTPEKPALSAPDCVGTAGLDQFGTCRYVDILRDGGGRELFAEVARTDGAFELRRCDFSDS